MPLPCKKEPKANHSENEPRGNRDNMGSRLKHLDKMAINNIFREKREDITPIKEGKDTIEKK